MPKIDLLAMGAERAEVDGRRVEPMRLLRGSPALDAPGLVYELKLDGARLVADVRGDEVALTYRTGRDCTATYPEIVTALRALRADRLVLDGEVVAYGADGRPDFELLQTRIRRTRPTSSTVASAPVTFAIFDVLAIGALDVRRVPLVHRKRALATVLRRRIPSVQLVPHFEDGRSVHAFSVAHKLEGIVAKRSDSRYVSGNPRGEWVKLKNEIESDFVITGFRVDDRDHLDAISIASLNASGSLVPRGSVELGRLGGLRGVLASSVSKVGRRWHDVRPQFVANVRYLHFTSSGRLRSPVFRGLRFDVRTEECRTA
jgi:bifunctional non-homologous end joining protein LigD